VTAAVEVQDLSLREGRSIVLDRVNLQVPSGRVVAVVGRPRTGKSALLNAILGRPANFTGTVRVCNFDARHESKKVRSQITWIGQFGVLEPHLTTRQNVQLILKLAGSPAPGRATIERALRESDLPDRSFDQRGHSLTPLETLITWVAVARLRQTPVIMLDDPTSTFGPSESRRTAHLLRELLGGDRTILVTTRDRQFADDVSDIVHVLDGGRLSGVWPAYQQDGSMLAAGAGVPSA
jgi:ABC-type multidrug transport system ATPase subunit